MRDEKKAGLLFAAMLIAFLIIVKLRNQVSWNAAAPPVPAAVQKKQSPPSEVQPPSGMNDFVAAYGSPTSEEASGHEKHHPPIAIQWLDYEPEHVRVAFAATGGGEDPPIRKWVAIAYMDALENRSISAHDAGLRLITRRKQLFP